MIKYLLLTLATFTTLSASPWLDAVIEDYENGKYALFLSYFERTYKPQDEEKQKLDYAEFCEEVKQQAGTPDLKEIPFPFDPKGYSIIQEMENRIDFLDLKVRQILRNEKMAEAAVIGVDVKNVEEMSVVLLLDLKNRTGPLPLELDAILDMMILEAEKCALEVMNTPFDL